MKKSTFLQLMIFLGIMDIMFYLDYNSKDINDDDVNNNVIEEEINVLRTFNNNVNDDGDGIVKAIPIARVAFPSLSFIEFLEEKEGFFPNRYKCPANVTTIGYGITKSGIEDAQRMGFLSKDYELPITTTRDDAENFLINIIIPTYEKMVRKNVHVPLNNNQLQSLISFSFNLGERRLQTLAKQLNKKDYNIAPVMMKYCYAKKKKLKGLVSRRKKEAEIWNEI